MEMYKETADTWNKIASLYEDKFMDLPYYNESYDAICSLVQTKGAKILEIGCGPGNISKYLLKKRPDFEITGIDVAPNMVELAKKNNPKAEFISMDSRDILSLNKKFDAIICGFCIPYLNKIDCQNLFNDCSKLLNEDGLIYMSFVHGNSEQSGYQTNSAGDRMYFHFHQREKVESWMIESGFIMVKSFKVEYPKANEMVDIHDVLIARKQSN